MMDWGLLRELGAPFRSALLRALGSVLIDYDLDCRADSQKLHPEHKLHRWLYKILLVKRGIR